MNTPVRDAAKAPSAEERLRLVLLGRGPQTIEQLAGLSKDMTWSQVLLAVDRLSRSGVVLIRKTDHCAYLVSLREGVGITGPEVRSESRVMG